MYTQISFLCLCQIWLLEVLKRMYLQGLAQKHIYASEVLRLQNVLQVSCFRNKIIMMNIFIYENFDSIAHNLLWPEQKRHAERGQPFIKEMIGGCYPSWAC